MYKRCILTNIKSKKPLIISCDEVKHPEYSMISHAFLNTETGELYVYTFSVLEPSTDPKTILLTIIELP